MGNIFTIMIIELGIICMTPFFWAYVFYKRSKTITGKMLCFVSPFLIIAGLISLRKLFPETQLSYFLFRIYYYSCLFSYLIGLIFFIMQRLKKALAFKISLCLGVSLIYLLFFCFYITWEEKARAVSSSDNREMRNVKATLQEYEINHGGILPCYTDEISKGFSCPINNIPYQWTKRKYVINDDPNLMLVWDSKPHGVLFEWRAVVFIDTLKNPDKELEMISEGKFQKLLKKQQECIRYSSNERLSGFIKKMKEGNIDVQRGKAIKSDKIEDNRDIETLIVALKDKDELVRNKAIGALWELKDIRAVEPLVVVLKEDKNKLIRERAASILGELKDARAVEPLITALKDDKWYVRKNAVLALGSIKDMRVKKALVTALKDNDVDVRYAAGWMLKKMRDNWSYPKGKKLLKSLQISKKDEGDDGLSIQGVGIVCLLMLGFIFVLFIFCILPFICAYKVAQKLKKRLSKILCFVTASLILITFLNNFSPMPPSLFLFYVNLKPIYPFIISIIAIFSLLIFWVEKTEKIPMDKL